MRNAVLNSNYFCIVYFLIIIRKKYLNFVQKIKSYCKIKLKYITVTNERRVNNIDLSDPWKTPYHTSLVSSRPTMWGVIPDDFNYSSGLCADEWNFVCSKTKSYDRANGYNIRGLSIRPETMYKLYE